MKCTDRQSGRLTIDLDALASNYRLLSARARPSECAAVVKADAYGLGVARVAPALRSAGCETFFVATLCEGVELRNFAPEARVFVLNGAFPGEGADFSAFGLRPVLNSLAQIESWAAFAARERRLTPPPAAIHIDTGMNRLGLSAKDAESLAARPELVAASGVELVMSHLACAEAPDSGMNEAQRLAFESLRGLLPHASASLANSAGVFLGPAYCLDLVRPGISLYGGNPTRNKINPMSEVIHLQGKIIQVRDVDSPMTVGYGATHAFTGPARVAIVGLGYADGYLRAASNRAFGCIGGVRVPVVGRVSMDLLAVDVTAADPESVLPGQYVSLIGGGADLDGVADAAGTISYELLTRLGSRLERAYLGGPAA